MLLAAPSPTQLDLNFRLLGVSVRVSPWFWLMSFLLSGGRQGQELLIWIPCVFVSILVHEFGHAMSSKLFGDDPYVILHGMGGLCFRQNRGRPWQEMIIILAGPGAGFLLAGLIYGGDLLLGQPDLGKLGGTAYGDLIFINLAWGIVNLVPIWPLDGGQFLNVVLSLINRRRASQWTHTVGLLGAGILALYLAIRLARDWVGTSSCSSCSPLPTTSDSKPCTRPRYGIDDDWWRR